MWSEIIPVNHYILGSSKKHNKTLKTHSAMASLGYSILIRGFTLNVIKDTSLMITERIWFRLACEICGSFSGALLRVNAFVNPLNCLFVTKNLPLIRGLLRSGRCPTIAGSGDTFCFRFIHFIPFASALIPILCLSVCLSLSVCLALVFSSLTSLSNNLN